MAADVRIDIAAQFVGKPAFDKADSATAKLTKNVKKLAGAIGIAYGTSAVIAYGKASVKAFADDEKAALRLNRAVENLGIGFANPAIADYIANLEKSAAIADDILRPAFQGLLTTTGSLTKSQELLNNAITISRASGVDLATVTDDLGKGYVGITKGLTKYNTGLTRAELQSKSFNEILGVILQRSAGAAEDYLGSTAYSMDVLSIATGNASEIIGGGLVQAFARIGGGTEVTDAQIAIENIATAMSKITIATGTALGGITNVLRTLKNLPKNIFQGFAGTQLGVGVVIPEKKEELELTLSQKKQEELLAKLEKEALKREKERLALLNKQNVAKKLQGVIDKANLALGKGSDVFDMDKIQIAAALTNQAEQLGKATNASQALQIANDTARLNVKKSILALEDAIASKDEAAIIAATNKLNADLKVLGALTGQSIKLSDIKSILESLKPVDLINLANLDAAIAKMMQLLALQGTKTLTPTQGNTSVPSAISTPSAISSPTAIAEVLTGIGSNLKEFTILTNGIANSFQTIDDVGSLNALTNLYAGGAINPFNAGSFRAAEGGSMFNSGAVGSRDINITVNTGVGDPNAIAEAIDDVLRQARDRGTLTIA